MKQHILNFVLVLVIAIGGMHLVQPATAQAYCPDCETCSVPVGEDPCPECFSDDCEEAETDGCGLLDEVGEDNIVMCDKEGDEELPGDN